MIESSRWHEALLSHNGKVVGGGSADSRRISETIAFCIENTGGPMCWPGELWGMFSTFNFLCFVMEGCRAAFRWASNSQRDGFLARMYKSLA